MRYLSRIYYFFTPYTDSRERIVARFFKGLTERSNKSRTQSKLDTLLQRDVAIINLWTEYRYKGYRYLRKSERRKLYTNLQLIAADFDRFYAQNIMSPDIIVPHLHNLSPQATIEPNRAVLLATLADYFSPRHGKYEYRESSSFGRLLRNPGHEKLVGDCNQIVTLYIYLYSRYFDVHDLQIRMLPEHVALHMGGIDIETTNGTFVNYEGDSHTLMPISEIVSINLLDTSDLYLSTHEVAAEDILQASRFAFILSHDRQLVTRNLDAAYRNVVNALMKKNNYGRALEFAKTSHDMAILNVVGHNGAVYEMKQNSYTAARHYAAYAVEREELMRNIWQSEGVYLYKAHRYHAAVKAFERAGDQDLVNQSYEALFFEEQKKLGSDLTTDSIKKYASTIKHMRSYAKKSGNKRLISHADGLSKHL